MKRFVAFRLSLLCGLVLSLQGNLLGQEKKEGGTGSDHYALPETDEGFQGSGPVRRYDWFKNLWKTRRAGWEAKRESDQGSVVFFGDSITQGWGDNFRNLFPGSKFANRGISGDTTRGMLYRLREDVLDLNPRGIVLLMGTNDLEEKAEPKVIAENLQLILKEIQEHNSKTPVVLCLVFPASHSKSRSSESIVEINKLYREVAKAFPQVTVIDTWTLFADEKGDAKLEEFPDLLHPNEVGYKKWAEALKPVLTELELLPSR